VPTKNPAKTKQVRKDRHAYISYFSTVYVVGLFNFIPFSSVIFVLSRCRYEDNIKMDLHEMAWEALP
jgi:hypothetical protein